MLQSTLGGIRVKLSPCSIPASYSSRLCPWLVAYVGCADFAAGSIFSHGVVVRYLLHGSRHHCITPDLGIYSTRDVHLYALEKVWNWGQLYTYLHKLFASHASSFRSWCSSESSKSLSHIYEAKSFTSSWVGIKLSYWRYFLCMQHSLQSITPSWCRGGSWTKVE